MGVGGGEERLGSQRERGGLSLPPGSERRKTIGVQMDASPLFLDDLPLPSSVPSLHPSLLQSQDV